MSLKKDNVYFLFAPARAPEDRPKLPAVGRTRQQVWEWLDEDVRLANERLERWKAESAD